MGAPLRVGRLGAARTPVDVTPVAVALVVMAGCFAGLATRRAELAGSGTVPASEPTVSVALGVVAGLAVAVLVALSFVVHVAGHVLAARRLGLPLARLEISAAGGIAWLRPGDDRPVAAAPAVTPREAGGAARLDPGDDRPVAAAPAVTPLAAGHAARAAPRATGGPERAATAAPDGASSAGPTLAQMRAIAVAGPLATGAVAAVAGLVALASADPATPAAAAADETALWALRVNLLVLAVNLAPVGRLDAAVLWVSRAARAR